MITKIDETEGYIKLHIYPNPSSDIITIATTTYYDNSFIYLYSTSGQILIKQQVQGYKTKVDISTLKPGIYFIKYDSQYKTLSTSFIKE